MLTLVSRTTLGKWFDRRRGLASGTSGVFVSCGFSAAPLLLSFFIDGMGWRGAWLSLAALVGLGMGMIGWLFYRDNPEECGLVMDGQVPTPVASYLPRNTPEAKSSHAPDTPPTPSKQSAVSKAAQGYGSTTRDFTRREAVGTLVFWAVTIALASQALTITGITFHIVDIGASVGLPQKQTVAIFLPIAMVSMLTSYLIGIISDRGQLRVLFIAMMVFEAIGLTGIAHLDRVGLRIFAIVGLGLSGGCFGLLSAVSMPRYFGRQHLGAISGVKMMTLVMASSTGPSLLAIFKALFGSYRWGLYLFAGIPLAIIFLLIRLRNPQE